MAEDALSCGSGDSRGMSVGYRCSDWAYISCEFALCPLLNQTIALQLGSAQKGGMTRDAVAAPFAETLHSSAVNRGFRARGPREQDYLGQKVHRLRDSILTNNQRAINYRIATYKFVQLFLDSCDGLFPSVFRLDPLQEMFTIPGHPVTTTCTIRAQSGSRIGRNTLGMVFKAHSLDINQLERSSKWHLRVPRFVQSPSLSLLLYLTRYMTRSRAILVFQRCRDVNGLGLGAMRAWAGNTTDRLLRSGIGSTNDGVQTAFGFIRFSEKVAHGKVEHQMCETRRGRRFARCELFKG